jgi:hypothetical protein
MIAKLDGATVLMLSNKGSYGSIEIVGHPNEAIEVRYLAICKYGGGDGIYLFLCDDEMSVEQDALFDSVDEALANAQRRSPEMIQWEFAE